MNEEVDERRGYRAQKTLEIEYHLFPSACCFPCIQIPLLYRFRPTSLGARVHEIIALQPVPDGEEQPAPAEVSRRSIEDPYCKVDGFTFAFVLDQDTENFHRQWAGMNATLKSGQALNN
ncbi:MAG: hypothetical protein ACI8Z1_000007 [Candidatus Azotimanducaceae bacterium]|jgi:hypothetical protein